MQINRGDLVRVRLANFKGFKKGIVLDVIRKDWSNMVVVQPFDGTKQLLPHPSHVEVINASR
ncbi:MAG: hypothetical protein VW683_11340 [Betaproteobacteria bacterium]|jgi:ribosomal protein L24